MAGQGLLWVDNAFGEKSNFSSRISCGAIGKAWLLVPLLLGHSCKSPNPFLQAKDYTCSTTTKVSYVQLHSYTTTQCHLDRCWMVNGCNWKSFYYLLRENFRIWPYRAIPTFHLSEFVDELLPVVVHLRNSSVAEWVLPACHKHSIIYSLLRRWDWMQILTATTLNSNLTLLLKAIERTLVRQMVSQVPNQPHSKVKKNSVKRGIWQESTTPVPRSTWQKKQSMADHANFLPEYCCVRKLVIRGKLCLELQRYAYMNTPLFQRPYITVIPLCRNS